MFEINEGMGACCAYECRQKGRKGVRLFTFPRDVERRKLWAQRANVDPSGIDKELRLCQLHFDDSQFELHRADGWRKLKQNAVPSVFGEEAEKRFNETGNSSGTVLDLNNTTFTMQQFVALERINDRWDHTYCNRMKPQPPEYVTRIYKIYSINAGINSNEKESCSNFEQYEEHDPIEITNNCDTEKPTDLVTSLRRELAKKEYDLFQINNKHELERKKWLNAEKQLLKTKKKYKKLCDFLLKYPLIKNAINKVRRRKSIWNSRIMKTAVQIQRAVGWKKYNFIQKQLGIPLPNYRTLHQFMRKNYVNYKKIKIS